METEHFIFYGDSPVEDLKNDALRLERFDSLMRRYVKALPDPRAPKLVVYSLRGGDAIKTVYQKDVFGAFYSSGASGAIAVVPNGSAAKGDAGNSFLFWQHTLRSLLQTPPIDKPGWYVDGYSLMLEATSFSYDGTATLQLPSGVAQPLLNENPIAMEVLLTSSTQTVKPAEQWNFRARSWLLAHYLTFTKERRGQNEIFLARISEGLAPLAAAQSAFGDISQLGKDLDDYLRGKLRSWKIPTAAPQTVDFKATVLDGPTGLAMPYEILLRGGPDPGLNETVVRSLRKLNARYPHNAGVLTNLAEAELNTDNFAAAEIAADEGLKLAPENPRLLLWKGLAAINRLRKSEAADVSAWEAARLWIDRAARADPREPMPVFEYYRSFRTEGRDAPASAIEELRKIVENSPQVAEYRFAYSYELARKGDLPGAIRLLQPVANSPYFKRSKEPARKIIEVLKGASADKASTIDLKTLFGTS